MQREHFRAYFDMRGLEVKDVTAFFRILEQSAGSSEVSLEAFITGCMRLTGQATSLDLQTLAFDTKMLLTAQAHYRDTSLKQLVELQSNVASISDCIRALESRLNG